MSFLAYRTGRPGSAFSRVLLQVLLLQVLCKYLLQVLVECFYKLLQVLFTSAFSRVPGSAFSRVQVLLVESKNAFTCTPRIYFFHAHSNVQDSLKFPARVVPTQWRTFVEIVGSHESLHHQLKRQDRDNFWGA